MVAEYPLLRVDAVSSTLIVLLAVSSPQVAVIVTLPAATAVTTPLASTVAFDSSDVLQVTAPEKPFAV